MRNALHTRPADDTPYREDMTAHQESEHKLRTFRLFDGVPEDASRPETRGVNWAVVVWFGSFLTVLFCVMLIGAIYALKFAGWV